MSLSKQLLILLTLLFFIIFSVSFVLSVGNIKNYLEVESEFHVQDTATSLGLSLSPHISDENDPIIRTMMNAIFDMGYYKEMRLVDVDGEELVVLENTEQMEGVPDWLINLFPMQVATATTEISSGWNISGTLYVTANPGYGYLKLYEQAKATFTYSILIFIASLLLLVTILRLTLQPLKEIERQANQISEGNFVTLSTLPWTLEVRNVAISMNSMSRKIGEMINRLNGRLDTLSENLKLEPLTKLFNQATFEVDLKRALSSGQTGYAALMRFDDLGSLSKQMGKEAIDQLLIEFAEILRQQGQYSKAYRLQGAEFALLLSVNNSKELKALLTALQHDLEKLGKIYQLDELVHIGVIRYERSSDYDKLYPAMIEAYEQAKIIASNAYFIKEDLATSMSELAWKEVISDAIDNNTPEITFTALALNYQQTTPQQVMEEAFTVVKDQQGQSLSIGTFFSMAQEFDLVESLDKCIVNKVILLMEEKAKNTAVTINLSMSSVRSHQFSDWLKARVENSKLDPKLLTFSVTAYSAMKDITAFANFCHFVKSFGATTLLKRYSSDIIDIELLKDLHIDYLRLARDLTTDIEMNPNKAQFLEVIQDVASLLDIKVLAEAVIKDNDFALVKAAHLYGISR